MAPPTCLLRDLRSRADLDAVLRMLAFNTFIGARENNNNNKEGLQNRCVLIKGGGREYKIFCNYFILRVWPKP